MKLLLLVLTLIVSTQVFSQSKSDVKKCQKILKKWKASQEKKLTEDINKLKCIESNEELKYEYKRVLAGFDSKYSYKESKVKKSIERWLASIISKYGTFNEFKKGHDGRRKHIEKKFGDCLIKIYPEDYKGAANVQVVSTLDVFKQNYNGPISGLASANDLKSLFESKKLIDALTKYTYDGCIMRN